MKITLSGFRGENRALPPLNLPETVGVSSINQNPARGDLRPWKAPLTVATVPAGTKTIYRMGRDVASDANYWLSWSTTVHVVRGSIADDTTEKTYFTGDGYPQWTDNNVALYNGAPYPNGARRLGVPAPTQAPTMYVSSSGVSPINETRFYCYSYVSDQGEEGAPSAVSLPLVCKTDATVTIGYVQAGGVPGFAYYNIQKTRIYRTQGDASGTAEFFFLLDVSAASYSTTDDNRALGEVMPSTNWHIPPIDLSGLTGMWNGMMGGITVNAVRFCAAYQPHAWPPAYEVLPVDSKPVALATFGQALLVLTTGKPVLVTGGSPDALDSQPLEIAEACVSAASVVSFGHGVAWACPDGLAYFGVGGAKMITSALMTRDDWQAIKPETILGTIYEGSYLGFYIVGGVTKSFLIDPLQPTGLYFADIPGKAVFFDALQDQLYLLDGNNIKKWNAGAALTTSFKSKLFRTSKPTNFACAELIADAYPVTFKLYADNALKYTLAVANAQPFRLPSGYLATTWQIELSSTGAVQGAALAQSMSEIAEV